MMSRLSSKLSTHLCYVFILGDICKTVISIYAQETLAPLPSLEEILVCNQRTTVEEVVLFLPGLFYVNIYRYCITIFNF